MNMGDWSDVISAQQLLTGVPLEGWQSAQYAYSSLSPQPIGKRQSSAPICAPYKVFLTAVILKNASNCRIVNRGC